MMFHKDIVKLCKGSLGLSAGIETSSGMQSISSYTRVQEWKYYTPSRGIQKEERMRIPMPGATL
jgi:hypothetical protein